MLSNVSAVSVDKVGMAPVIVFDVVDRVLPVPSQTKQHEPNHWQRKPYLDKVFRQGYELHTQV